MSILIKGMEMPKSCGEYKLCLYVFSDGTAKVEGEYYLFEGEPFDAVPVPPHGRLGDLDAALKKLNRICLPDDLSYTIGHDIAKQFLKDAPTIIPADPAKEET